MDNRIGVHGGRKPLLTVTGAKLQPGVNYSKRGIGGDRYVYLDIRQGNQVEAVEAVKASLKPKSKAKKVKTDEAE
jgi:hypothetical protein